MKNSIFFLSILILTFGCKENNSNEEEITCGTLFCSTQGAMEIEELKNESFYKDTLKLQLNIAWLGNFGSFSNENQIKTKVDSLIYQLNEDFKGANIRFVKSNLKFYNDILFIEDALRAKKDKKLQKKYGNQHQINLFFLDRKGTKLNGYTPIFTEKFNHYKRTKLNIVLVVKESLTNRSTITHELGHFFGLQHTFGENSMSFSTLEKLDMSNCASSGDYICDTPADPNIIFNGFNCDKMMEYEHNGIIYNPPVKNYMSYYPSHCRKEFSKEQLVLMNKFANKYRKYLTP